MRNGLHKTDRGIPYEYYDGQIMVEHENGYYGCLHCGGSAMSIFHGNQQILHVGVRNKNITTADDLYDRLADMPRLIKILRGEQHQTNRKKGSC